MNSLKLWVYRNYDLITVKTHNRNNTIDIAKGIGILLIVWGHCGGWGILSNLMYIINTFHVPLFFLLSVLFIDTSKPFKVYVKNKASRLLKPYFIYGLIAFFIYIGVTECNADEIKHQLIRYLLCMRDRTYIFTGALWFLPSLFCSLCLCYAVMKYVPHNWGIIACIYLITSMLNHLSGGGIPA